MSGIDEQGVTPCGCKGFKYWLIRGNAGALGFLNPDAWMETESVNSVNTRTTTKYLTKERFIRRITQFRCNYCGKEIREKHILFKILVSNVGRRWNVKYVRNR